ncbi:hypothetical protein ABFY59_25505 [Priestia aryabhattai]|uniref:hypothetical protein n=1 Tax=Priestia aryabhattai TaxID=412384 RepID=UPI003D26AD9F
MNGNVRTMKWVTAGYEALLGIPLIGGSIVIGFGYTPLVIACVLHIIALILANRRGISAYGNILGIVTSIVSVIPIIGMIMHILTAFVIAIDAARQR